MDVNPGMIEDCLTENDFVAVVCTDFVGGRFNEDTADAPLLEEGEKTVNNNIVRLVGHANDKIHYMASLKRCFDIVFQRPYGYFSIPLNAILSLSDRYKIFAND